MILLELHLSKLMIFLNSECLIYAYCDDWFRICGSGFRGLFC